MKFKNLLEEAEGDYISFQTHNDDNSLNTDGTSRQGILDDTSYFDLVDSFGDPLPRDMTPEGTEWIVEFTVNSEEYPEETERVPVTIYDRKNQGPNEVRNNRQWTVGGRDYSAIALLQAALDRA